MEKENLLGGKTLHVSTRDHSNSIQVLLAFPFLFTRFIHIHQKECFGVRSLAQLLKSLAHKNEDLSLDLQHLQKRLGVMARLCNPSAGEAEKDRLLIDLSSQDDEHWVQEQTCELRSEDNFVELILSFHLFFLSFFLKSF